MSCPHLRLAPAALAARDDKNNTRNRVLRLSLLLSVNLPVTKSQDEGRSTGWVSRDYHPGLLSQAFPSLGSAPSA